MISCWIEAKNGCCAPMSEFQSQLMPVRACRTVLALCHAGRDEPGVHEFMTRFGGADVYFTEYFRVHAIRI